MDLHGERQPGVQKLDQQRKSIVRIAPEQFFAVQFFSKFAANFCERFPRERPIGDDALLVAAITNLPTFGHDAVGGKFFAQ
jgi:hypothetical protein